MSRRMRGNLLLLLTAAIWGFAFVAQKAGGKELGPLTFNGVRSFLGGGLLLVLLPLLDRLGLAQSPATRQEKKTLWLGGLLCGLALFLATNLQQLGVLTTTTGKAGFITSLYIVLVPVFGLIIRRKTTLFHWLGVALAVVGLYLLCMQGSAGIGQGDLLVMACAPMLALQILLVDRFAPRVDGVRLSCIQFFTVGVLNLPLMFCFETPSLTAMTACWDSVLYAGLISSGVAYTLQIVAQKETHPTTASVLMSLESVFAVLSGMLFLGDRMTPRESAGCLVMFGAVLLAQLPQKKGR
ncbi:MAG: DMT family transporter [Ruminococcaceae bacterium]|nr:DMT family transporter [Oscillospiraceae bacterium]